MIHTIKQILNMRNKGLLLTLKEVEAIDARVADAEAGAGYVYVPVDAAAAKTDITPAIFLAPSAGTIDEIQLVPNGALAKSDTDYLTLKALKNGETDICTAKTTQETGGIALVENTAVPFTMVAAKTVALGDRVEFSSVNTGSTGAAFPGGLIRIKFTPS